MRSLYAMRRANGDWFALEKEGGLSMPVFRSSGAAMQARGSHWGMFLFKPMVFDELALNTLAAEEGVGELRFWLVDDPFVNINRGRALDQKQLDLLIHNGSEQPRS